jgi:DNA-binding transcriptional regulator YiaG
MKIETSIIISRSGNVRMPNKNARVLKDEIMANLTLDVPDSAFAPPVLSMRATVSNGTVPAASTPARPTAIDTKPWNAERVRRLRSLLGMERDELARSIGITLTTLRGWEDNTSEIGGSFKPKLFELERGAPSA